MNANQQRGFASLQRSAVFIDAHQSELGDVVNSAARRALYAAIDSVKKHSAGKGSAVRDGQGGVSQQETLAGDLAEMHMKPIAKFARTKLRGVPDIAALTKAVRGSNAKQLLEDARSMATVAARFKDRFVAESFPADFIDQLDASADALEAAMQSRVESTERRKTAKESIDKVIQNGRDAVRVIDALIKRQLKSNDPLLATWMSESRVFDKPGKARQKPDPKDQSPTPTAGTPTIVTPSVPKAA